MINKMSTPTANNSPTPSTKPSVGMDGNVCKDQNTFNDSVGKALDHNNKKKLKKFGDKIKENRSIYALFALLYLVLLLMAVFLAMKVKDDEHRILHLIIALVCPPTYIVGYYLSTLGKTA